jgi:hypothetical protein
VSVQASNPPIAVETTPTKTAIATVCQAEYQMAGEV